MRIIGTIFLLFLISEINANNNVECKVEIFDIGFQTKSFYCKFDDSIAITKPTALTNLFNANVTDLLMGSNKKIQYLPQGIGEAFPNLHAIEALDCSIKSINELNFNGLTKMINIDLKKNEIETIDEKSFDDMVDLSNLYLDENKLTNLPAKVFEKLERLHGLFLKSNRLQKLDVALFKNNKNLALLYLNDNKLQTLPTGIFDGLTKVKQLRLNGNEIEDLPPHIFDDFESLIDLDLSRNKVSIINPNWLLKLNPLIEVSFSRNPLNFIDLTIFDNNPNLIEFFFNEITTKDIRHIERVDQMANIKGIGFYNTCVNGYFHDENLDELKRSVEKNCVT